VWDLSSRQKAATLRGYGGEISRLQFAPDGGTLLTDATAAPFHLWSTASWQERTAIQEPGRVPGVEEVSPDGIILAVGGADGTIRLSRAAAWTETDRPSPVASGTDRQVLVQWQPLPTAQGYRVYRGPEGAGPGQLRRLKAEPVTAASFLDRSPDLVNGRP